MFERFKNGDREIVTCLLDKQSCAELLVSIMRVNESVIRLNESLIALLTQGCGNSVAHQE